MRFTTVSLLFFAFTAAAAGQINPANQINWPTGSTGCVYAPATNTCVVPAGTGTAVKQNSGSTETSLAVTGFMPQLCADTSGSGTAQSCTTGNTFTPQTGNCIVYSTTTANSGTGLTVNVNSLGAKSVAVASSSGWTTTLVASSSVAANEPMHLCYDGTNWNASGTGYQATGGGGGGYTNVVASASGDTTVAAINAKCTGGQTYWASIPLSIATGGTVGAGCNVMFVKGGLWTVASGQTVTFTNPIRENDGPSSHFAGSGAVVLAAQDVYMEWFGGVADGNLGANTGTDNTAAWAATYAAITTGNVRLQCASYRFATTGPAITKSNVGIVSDCQPAPSFNTGTSMIFSSSSSASPIVNVSGSSSVATIQGNKLVNIQISRAAAPGASVIGLQVHFTGGTLVRDVNVTDSTVCFDIEYAPQETLGGFYSDQCNAGYNGVAQGTGAYIGWNMQGSTTGFLTTVGVGDTMAINTSVISSATTYGMNITGNLVDFNFDAFQVASATYGVYCNGCSIGQDVQMTNFILDRTGTGFYFSSMTGNTVEIRGGWVTCLDAGPCVELSAAGGVTVSDMKLYFGNAHPAVYVHNASLANIPNDSIVNNRFYATSPNSATQAIVVTNMRYTQVVGNTVYVAGGTFSNPMISFVGSNNSNVMSNEVTFGTGVGLSYDASSSGNCCGNLNNLITFTLSDSGTGNELALGFSNPMITLGDTITGGASGAPTRLAGPTTSTHQFLLGDVPSGGAAVAPAWFDLGPNLGTYVSGTSPIVVTQNANGVAVSCPTCGTSTSTAVNNNGGATLGTSQQDGMLPYLCPDSSGSGTAQSCNTATSFTPQTGNCVVYSTTTANSGTGLTVNINSLGAKSVAVAGSSGWTTTLMASSSIAANKPMHLCYDGTNWDASGTGYQASGGSSGNYVNITGSITWTNCTQSGGVCTTTGSVSSITAASIPGTYNNLIFVMNGVASAGISLNLTFNSDTSSHYAYIGLQWQGGAGSPNGIGGASASSIGNCATAGTLSGATRFEIPFYASASIEKTVICSSSGFGSVSSAGSNFYQDMRGFWNQTSAITAVTLTTSSGTISSGYSVSVYGTN